MACYGRGSVWHCGTISDSGSIQVKKRKKKKKKKKKKMFCSERESIMKNTDCG
jgi:hypothetical protein